MFLSTWPRKIPGSFENVRIHAISCQLTKFYNFTPKCFGQDLSETHFMTQWWPKLKSLMPGWPGKSFS